MNFDYAVADLERTKQLAASGALPQAELDDAQRAVDLARAQKTSALAQQISSAPKGADSRVALTALLQAEAQLAELGADGSARNLVPRKVGEANQRVMELIGLDADQFRQVMVLPQGRFRELLLAPSQEREAIFQQLFQTHVYARLERALKDGANALSAEVERLGERSRGLLEVVGDGVYNVRLHDGRVLPVSERHVAAVRALFD